MFRVVSLYSNSSKLLVSSTLVITGINGGSTENLENLDVRQARRMVHDRSVWQRFVKE